MTYYSESYKKRRRDSQSNWIPDFQKNEYFNNAKPYRFSG